MQIILLSGGSGKRLWPLSNDVRSKQFIKIFQREAGAPESMVMRVYRQLMEAVPSASVTIATGKKQVSSIQNQLGDKVGICVEPMRRDTFPAISLAACYLKEIRGVGEADPVVICPVDPFADTDFFRSLKTLGELAADGGGLFLMGMEPTYPSEKYGYILPESTDSLSGVRAFREKPDLETAKSYLAQGALWNGGIFACKLGYSLEKAHEQMEFTGYRDLYDHYENAPKISFDYAVVEKETHIRVLRYGGQWKDLGTWNTFAEAMSQRTLGKVILDDSCENTHVVNELNIPVLCMGCKDMVVAASNDGILVSDKGQSSYIKPYVDRIEQPIMYAEKSWGSFTVLDVQKESMVIRIVLMPGHSLHYHSHQHRDEVWTVMSGAGQAIVDGVRRRIGPGDVVSMPAGCRHTVLADTELILNEVQLGREISVEDKIKYDLETD